MIAHIHNGANQVNRRLILARLDTKQIEELNAMLCAIVGDVMDLLTFGFGFVKHLFEVGSGESLFYAHIVSLLMQGRQHASPYDVIDC